MRKKHIFSLFFALALCLIPAYATESITPTDSAYQISTLTDTQNAYTQLMQSFGPRATDTVTSYAYNYPDWYGGSYIEGDALYVNLTTDDVLVQRTVLEACGDFADVVRFRQVSYSLNNLLSLSEVLPIYKPDGLISVSVDEISNRVSVEIDADQNPDAVHLLSSIPSTLSQEVYCPDMLSVQVAENNFEFFDASPSSEQITNTAIPRATIYAYGGTLISNSNLTLLGSLGACGTYNTTGKDAFVTTGHFFDSTGTSVYFGGRSIGSVVKLDRTYDYAIIASNGYLTPTNRFYISSNVTAQFPGVLDPAIGSSASVYGFGTGQSTGTVVSKCQTLQTEKGTLKNLIRVESYKSGKMPDKGDSGSPVTVGLKMIGTVTGGSRNDQLMGWYLAPCTSWNGCFSVKLTA